MSGVLTRSAKTVSAMSLVSSPPGLYTELQDNPAINMAIALMMERMRLSRDMALEILRSEARAKRRRMNQVAEDLLKSVARTTRATTAVSSPARDAAAPSPERSNERATTLTIA
jgi:ANTAR domain